MKTRFMRDMFRSLNDAETREFVSWANDNYVAGEEINPTWHPVVRERCKQINSQVQPHRYDLS